MISRSPTLRHRCRGFFLFLALITLCPLPFISTARCDSLDLQKHLLVVYNSNDVDSEKLAKYYAEKRAIAADHVLGIETPDIEEITRAVYTEKIRDPINAYIVKQGWIKREPSSLALGPKVVMVQVAVQNDIWAIVLMRGIPLRIQNDPTIENDLPHTRPELNTNAAAVDSELATLPILGLPLNGPMLNPYYFVGYPRNFDAIDARRQILVTRLDAPTAQGVQRMIDDSLSAEANRLTGWVCLDARGLTDKSNHYTVGDDWIRHALSSFTREGWPVEFDNRPELIPDNLPINNVAIYMGWYTENAQGPFFHPPHRFAKGAVAYHLHSFSATTVRSDTSYWVGPLLNAGAAATMGCVYEPYLDLTPHIDIFVDRLLDGYTFAEAATASQKGLSWMTTNIGDPLYRPFREKLPEALAHARERNSLNVEWLELQQARLDYQKGTLLAADFKSRLIKPDITEITWEGYADLLNAPGSKTDPEEIIDAYRHALRLYIGALDQIRVGIKIAHLYVGEEKKDDAVRQLKQLIARWPRDADFFGLETELASISHPIDTSAPVSTTSSPVEPPVVVPTPVDEPTAP